jgi:hypothetical protein
MFVTVKRFEHQNPERAADADPATRSDNRHRVNAVFFMLIPL